MTHPIKNPKMVQNYSNTHKGLDLISNTNERNIYAIADGIVTYVRSNVRDSDIFYSPHGGNEIWINHGGGYISRYCHLKENSVKLLVGDKVKDGDIIGIEGDTGYAFGVHLHFELWFGGNYKYINPFDFIFGSKTIPSLNYGNISTTPTSNTTTLDTTFKVGDNVILNGTLYATSYGEKPGKTFNNFSATITKIANTSRKCPYLLNNGLGWVMKSAISKK